MSNTICPEEHEPRTDAKRAQREGLVDAGVLQISFVPSLLGSYAKAFLYLSPPRRSTKEKGLTLGCPPPALVWLGEH